PPIPPLPPCPLPPRPGMPTMVFEPLDPLDPLDEPLELPGVATTAPPPDLASFDPPFCEASSTSESWASISGVSPVFELDEPSASTTAEESSFFPSSPVFALEPGFFSSGLSFFPQFFEPPFFGILNRPVLTSTIFTRA